MQCLATCRLSTSPLHRHCYLSQEDELRARPVRTRIAGQILKIYTGRGWHGADARIWKKGVV